MNDLKNRVSAAGCYAAVFLIFLGAAAAAFAQTAQARPQNPNLAAYFARLAQSESSQAGVSSSAPEIPLRAGRTPRDVMAQRIQKMLLKGGSHANTTANDQLTVNLPQFATPPQFVSSGTDPFNVLASVQGDFNGDGIADVATLNEDGGLNILLNQGSGVMKLTSSETTLTVPAKSHNMMQIAAADVNGDGYADIVGMDVLTNQFFVWLSNGDGTVKAPVGYSVAPKSGASFFYGGGGIAIADVTGDGHPDVVAVSADYENGQPQTVVSLQVFPGKGDGTFGTPVESDTTLSDAYNMEFGSTLVLADVNGDGVKDAVVLLLDGGLNSTQGVGAMTAIGTGSGGFAALSGYTGAFLPNTWNTFSATSGMAVADLNKDGLPDVILNNGQDDLYVALNDGKGSFLAAQDAIPAITQDLVFELGDLDGDNVPDVVTFTDGIVTTYKGNGDGTFNTATPHYYAGGLGAGHQQPALANYTSPGNTSLGAVFISQELVTGETLLGNGDGTLKGVPILSQASVNPGYLNIFASGDLNGDGIPDFVAFNDAVENNSDHPSAQPSIVSLISDGKGGIAKTVTAVPYTYFNSVNASQVDAEPMAVDLNGDGIPDLLFSIGNDIEIALGNGDGSFQTPQVLALGRGFSTLDCPPGLSSAAKGSDGVLEFVVAYGGDDACYGPGGQPSGVFVFTNGGANVSFVALGSSLVDAQLYDIDSDGIPDLVTNDSDSTNGTYAAYVTHGIAGHTFDPNQTNVIESDYWVTGILTGDYNGDGKPDVALATLGTYDPGGGVVSSTGGVLLLPGNNDGTFGQATLADAGLPVEDAAWGDFNGDGHPDLVVTQFLGTYLNLYRAIYKKLYNVGVLPNAGDGTFPASLTYGLVNNPYLFTGDYNQDGNIDAVFKPSGGGVGLLLNAIPKPTFTVAGSPASLTLTQGATGVATLTVTANSAFQGTVSFTCAGAPAETTCTVNPTALTLSNGQSATVSIVVATTLPNNSYSASARRNSPLLRWSAVAGAAQLAGIFFLILPRRKRVSRMLLPLLMLAAVVSAGMLSGCNNGSSPKPPVYSGSPVGTVNLTITATSGKLSQSFQLPVTITSATPATTN